MAKAANPFLVWPPLGGPVDACRFSNHSGSKPCQPFATMASAAAFGSGQIANCAARRRAACGVSGFLIFARWATTPAERSSSSTAQRASRAELLSERSEDGGLCSLGGVGDLSFRGGVPEFPVSFRGFSSDFPRNFRSLSLRFRSSSASAISAMMVSTPAIWSGASDSSARRRRVDELIDTRPRPPRVGRAANPYPARSLQR
jgi:hypothetical protein